DADAEEDQLGRVPRVEQGGVDLVGLAGGEHDLGARGRPRRHRRWGDGVERNRRRRRAARGGPLGRGGDRRRTAGNGRRRDLPVGDRRSVGGGRARGRGTAVRTDGG